MTSSPPHSKSPNSLDAGLPNGAMSPMSRNQALKPQTHLVDIPNDSNSVQWHQIVSIKSAYRPRSSRDGESAHIPLTGCDMVSTSLDGQAVTLIVSIRLTSSNSPFVFCGQAIVPSVSAGDEISGWFDLQDAGGRPMYNEQGNQSKLYINLFYGQPRDIIESNGKKFSIM